MQANVLHSVETLCNFNQSLYKPTGIHWRTWKDQDQVLWLLFDKKDSSANTLSAGTLQELDEILNEIEVALPKALVIHSAKEKGFCAGADIKEFRNYNESEMTDMLRRGHAVLDRLANLSIPTIAVIHGHCLGGGLELALACDQRIGVKNGLEIGFPEIRLGVHPGLGGTFRLTHLIDPIEAMTMMLTGKSAYDKQNKMRGLIDDLVEQRHIESAVKAAIFGGLKKQKRSFKDYILSTSVARKLAAKRMRSVSEKKAPSCYYPAPYALIDLWEKHGGSTNEMQVAEIESFAKLLVSDTAQNLIRVFFLHQSLKNLAKGGSTIQHVHVIGAGSMGSDIAGWCAMQGLTVTLSDQYADPIAKAVQNTEKLCQQKHKSDIETRDTLDRLIPDMENIGLCQADLVIEAVPENIKIKKTLYQSIESKLRNETILATNTSSILIDQLTDGLKNPARFVGLHFFNPVSQMMVVEAVRHENTSDEIMQNVLSFIRRIGKTPAPVTSYPGFLVNRALTPYLLEAMVMLDEGINKEQIDRIAKNFGMPIGPIELADQIGLDICVHVADMLSDALDKPMAKIPDWLRKKVNDGKLGKKTGDGFYVWKNGKAVHDNKIDYKVDEKIIDRLILPMLDACVECYRLGIVEHLDHLDGTMIFATGFAPFRGGPIHYARSRGIDNIVNTLNKFSEQYGERFEPDKGWKDL